MMLATETEKLQCAHRSVRRFQDRVLDDGQLERLIRCGQSASSSSFIQAYSVIRVTDSGHREVIAKAAGGQPWITAAPEFLVFCADLRRVGMACERAGAGPLEGYSEHALAAIVDVSLMAQNLMLAAESEGLGGVFIGGIRNDPTTVVQCLRIPDAVLPVFGMCLGWPDEDNAVKPRWPIRTVMHQDEYCDCGSDEFDGYDAELSRYYADRGVNSRIANWSSATAAAVQGKKRPHMFGFLQRRGFFRR
jgi:nitroreductase